MPEVALDAIVRERLADFLAQDLLDRTSLRYAETLLILCLLHEGDVRRSVESTPPGWELDLVHDVADEAFGELVGCDSTSLGEDVLRSLSALVARAAQEAPAGLADLALLASVHAVAVAVDAVFHRRWLSDWRAMLVTEVRAGDPHPVSDHDPRHWLGTHKANTPSGKFPSRPLHALPHLRLGDGIASSFRIKVNYDLWGHSSPMESVTRLGVATCQINMGLQEFVLEEDRTREPPVVHNKGPAHPERQLRLAVEAVTAAARGGAQIVVLPEYALAIDQREAFRQELEASPDRPLLVVGGSSETHEPMSPDPVNEGWLLLPDEAEKSLYKMFPAVVGDLTEGALGRRDLVVWPTPSFTLAVLICRDATSPEVMTLLAQLGVSLLLVPAFSPRTGTILALPMSLSTTSQAFVAVGIGPAVWDPAAESAPPCRPEGSARDEAGFSAPYEQSPFQYVAPGQTQPPPAGPGVWLFDVAERSLGFLETGSEGSSGLPSAPTN